MAAELGVHAKTVSRAVQRSSKLDPSKAQIDQLLSEGVWQAVLILREKQVAGYSGKSSIWRDYIRPKGNTIKISKTTGQEAF